LVDHAPYGRFKHRGLCRRKGFRQPTELLLDMPPNLLACRVGGDLKAGEEHAGQVLDGGGASVGHAPSVPEIARESQRK
jgi:hypothetical protein